jgi:hypothetical protein
MAILTATDSFIVEAGGQRHEIHEGSLLSDSHPAAQAKPKSFAAASEDDVRLAVHQGRGYEVPQRRKGTVHG